MTRSSVIEEMTLELGLQRLICFLNMERGSKVNLRQKEQHVCAKAQNNEKIKYMQGLKVVKYGPGLDYQRTLNQ